VENEGLNKTFASADFWETLAAAKKNESRILREPSLKVEVGMRKWEKKKVGS
jgi:hypothetical protein